LRPHNLKNQQAEKWSSCCAFPTSEAVVEKFLFCTNQINLRHYTYETLEVTFAVGAVLSGSFLNKNKKGTKNCSWRFSGFDFFTSTNNIEQTSLFYARLRCCHYSLVITLTNHERQRYCRRQSPHAERRSAFAVADSSASSSTTGEGTTTENSLI